ncbi:MAG: SDR family oxidoreductase [Candidatus Auribacterota bacterium]|jgi:NAD(P)-dependent dehydrogenase (short-subunit alcohol dehydrogenase family)|nr:SDR family oxidoreductase [Candidatus Auribacterota bacterium]
MSPTALITGAGKRIGRELALYLAGQGYDIAAHYHLSQQSAHTLAEDIRRMGRKCVLFQADLSSHTDAEHLMEAVIQQCEGLELLINNASVFNKNSIGQTDFAFLQYHFMINCFAPMLLSRDFAKHLARGHIINILDTKITRSKTVYCAYTLSKKTLAEFTKMAAVEFAPDIRVNAVAPGVILAPPDKDEQYLASLITQVPLKRKGEPSDICGAVNFLIANKYITGQILYIDGGENLL